MAKSEMSFLRWSIDNKKDIGPIINNSFEGYLALKKAYIAGWDAASQPVVKADAVYDPVCSKCGDALITEELLCDECRGIAPLN